MDVAKNPAILALGAILRELSKPGVPRPENVRIQGLREYLWRDSCLGAPEPDEECEDVVVPRFVIDIEGGLRFHTDSKGGFRRVSRSAEETDIRLRFARDGGPESSHAEFKAESDTLSLQSERELRHLIDEASFFSLSPGEPGNITDAYTYTIWLAVGRRRHVVLLNDSDIGMTPQVRPLLDWLMARLPENGRGNVVETAVI